jgi:sialate O-acetylesterase
LLCEHFFAFFPINLLISITSFTQLRLPAVISSGMVLQQNDSVTFWGWGYNGQLVKVTGSWNKDTASVRINNHGKWSMKIKTPAEGGPYSFRLALSLNF